MEFQVDFAADGAGLRSEVAGRGAGGAIAGGATVTRSDRYYDSSDATTSDGRLQGAATSCSPDLRDPDLGRHLIL